MQAAFEASFDTAIFHVLKIAFYMNVIKTEVIEGNQCTVHLLYMTYLVMHGNVKHIIIPLFKYQAIECAENI